jgi:hypothetical protein
VPQPPPAHAGLSSWPRRAVGHPLLVFVVEHTLEPRNPPRSGRFLSAGHQDRRPPDTSAPSLPCPTTAPADHLLPILVPSLAPSEASTVALHHTWMPPLPGSKPRQAHRTGAAAGCHRPRCRPAKDTSCPSSVPSSSRSRPPAKSGRRRLGICPPVRSPHPKDCIATIGFFSGFPVKDSRDPGVKLF